MDARNFLRAINNSAQSKVVFFESVVRRLGQEAKKNFKLVALHPTSLYFEDVSTHQYYVGDIKKDGVRFLVDNIKRINVIEEKKADLFDKNCVDLINAIAEQDYKSAEKVFNKIELQRFRSRVIPESGFVMTRDNEVRKINLNNGTVKEDCIPQIVKAFADAVTDNVELSEGQVVRGTFMETGEQFIIPIDEYTRRRVVARKMRQVAENAHHFPSFQKLVSTVASKVIDQKVAEAVELAAKFLKEEQEFCLLGAAGMRQLVESALASQMEFNSFLVNDVATLMHKTNLKVNHDTIVECWAKTAQKSQNAELLIKTRSLSEAKDFDAEYELFLETIFNETGDIDSNRAKAYLTSLRVIKSVLGHMEGQEQLTQDMTRMIGALETDQPATDVVMQAEELLASLSDEIVGRVENLGNFDSMPGVEEEPMSPEDEQEEEAPVPLPELGGEEETPDLGLPGGAPAGAPMGAAPEPAMAGMESKKKAAEPLSEGDFTSVEKMSLIELQEELLGWKTDGHIFLKEDGFEDCYGQLNRIIDRCMAIGPTADTVRENFEEIRDVVIDSGNDVSLDLPEDPYAGSVNLKENVKIKSNYAPIAEDLGGVSGPEKGPKHGGDASGMGELQTGTGLTKKETKNVDGTDSSGAPNNAGSESQEVGLGMAKDHMNKTKGLASKDLKKVSGCDASGVPNKGGAESQELGTDMAKDHLGKSKSIAEEVSFIDKIAETLGEEDLKVGTSYKTGAGYTKAHDIEMDEQQGPDGVETGDGKKVSGRDASGVPNKGGAESQELGTDMAKDYQDKTKGLAEGEEGDEAMIEVPNGDEKPANEDQYKGPRQHKWGRKKAAIAPREMKEDIAKIADGLNEDVAVFKTDDRLDDVIMKVLEHMKGDEVGGPLAGGAMGEMPPAPMGDMPPADLAPMGGEMGAPGGEPVGDEMPMGGPAPAADAAGHEFDAENIEAGIPPEGAPGHDEMEGPEEKAAEVGAEAGGPPPFGGKEEGSDEKKGPPPPKKEKSEKEEKPEKKEKKDDDDEEKKESFDSALNSKLKTLTEGDYCVDCDSKNCKCPPMCKKCGKDDCVCK
jgi:hypothetical protein